MPKGGTVTIRTANESLTDAATIGNASMPAGDYVRVDVEALHFLAKPFGLKQLAGKVKDVALRRSTRLSLL
jgi:hypothetical protein